MPQEQFANDLTGGTTLATALTDGTGTSVVVTSAATFPATPNFRIRIESEIMLVTAVSGTTFTVTRGAEGTTGAAHGAGVGVFHIITATSILQPYLRYAKYPAAPAYVEPKATDFTLINTTGSPALSQNSVFGMKLTKNAESLNNCTFAAKAVTATPYTVTALIRNATPTPLTSSQIFYGLGWIQGTTSGTSKSEVIDVYTTYNGSDEVQTQYFPSWTSTSTGLSSLVIPTLDELWFQITDNGSSRIFKFSADGVNFVTANTVSNTDQFTAGYVGVYLMTRETGVAPVLNIMSYSVT